MPSNCKLCHGPLATAASGPSPTPLIQASAERAGIAPPMVIDCHMHCLAFACPGCVAKDRPSFSLLSMNNHIYDYHCDACMADEVANPMRTGTGSLVHGPVVHFSAGSHGVAF